MTTFMKIKKKKKKQSSFTTLHGILLSLAIAILVGGLFVGGGLLSPTIRLISRRGVRY